MSLIQKNLESEIANDADEVENKNLQDNNNASEVKKDLKINNYGNKKNRKRITIADSDSDDEDKNEVSLNFAENELVENNVEASKQNVFLDSDSDDNSCSSIKNVKNDTNKIKKKFNFSDNSEDESEVITPLNKSFTNENNVIENILEDKDIVINKQNWSALCDPESSDSEINEGNNDNTESEKEYDSGNEVVKPIKYRRKKKKEKENIDELDKMAKQRDEIRSDSQRMIRESNVSLPYHRPKTYKLKEFLAKRPKFASIVPLSEKMPPSVAIKMSIQQLEIISKKLEERHKEVIEFYKSESEPEEIEEDKDYIPPNNINKETTSLEDENKAVDLEKNANCNNIFLENKDLQKDETEKCLEPLEKELDHQCDAENNLFENKDYVPPNNINKETTSVEDENKAVDLEKKTNCYNTDLEINENQDLQIYETEKCSVPLEKELDHQCEAENNVSVGSKINIISNVIINENENKDPKNLLSKNENEINDEQMNYEFNLDDSEKNLEEQETNKAIESESIENSKNEFVFNELDKEIENFRELSPKKTKLDILKERLSNIQPRLSGGPNNIIDLDETSKHNEVVKLMERFAKHTIKKPHQHKESIKLNVTSVESNGIIHKETVALHADEEEDLEIEEKPGVRLQRLRNQLQSQIAQRKSELWKQKNATSLEEKDPYEGEKSDCGADDGILDDDEEEELSESSEEDEEVEEDNEVAEDVEVEEDEAVDEKKSGFIDDEAEDSDDGEIEGGSEYNDVEDEEIIETEKIEQNENELIKKPLRRIVKGFTEDSDEDDEVSPLGQQPGETIKKISEKLNRNNCNNIDPISTQEDYIRPYQIQNANKTPVKSLSECSNADMKFLTPVSYITGLQNLANSTSKLNVPSPLKEMNWHTELERKLEEDSIITHSQAQAMRELCSDDFSQSQNINGEENSLNKNTGASKMIEESLPNTQEILNVCSGEFGESSNVLTAEESSTQDLLNICSGTFTGVTQVSQENSTKVITNKLNEVNEIKTLGEDQDMLISQLLNEEEMETFKKKFDSPNVSKNEEEAEEVIGGGVLDSDDDESLEVKKKKHQKKLMFSDDESSEEEIESEEEIKLHDEIEVNYDSEENEVELTEVKGKEKVKMSDFFEDEAELSESEWGSADEDEKDLDDLEFEIGDKEKFDEKQLKNDLERIHMRRLLDDDSKEVKLLQEMLLDDGELHGTGRERQFRWKNVDFSFPGDEEKKESDDEGNFEEDQTEEEWRRKRHEREMFLMEKKSQELNDEELLSGSTILKIGHKMIQKSLSNSQNTIEKNTGTDSSPSIKKTFSIMQKRGSFLNRGDQVLERLAEYNKISATEGVIVGKVAKNSKNFLFQTVAKETVNTTSFSNLKRKADDGTPKVIKKLRLTDNLSPADKKMRDKRRKAKLFGLN